VLWKLTTDTTYSSFVNDDDSDDDGLQDGIEDIDGNGEWDGTVGGTGTTGSGETHLCLADTDGDGLTDGEEEALFGRGGIDVHSTLGTITTTALDDDSDDDGLSDYEEQVVTGTDPLNWDSDGDGLSDADELIVTGGAFPNRSFYQESDPLDPDTDDDGLPDNIEYPGTGVTRNSTASSNPGTPDETCPFVNGNDSDDDGLQDGYEDANQDGTIANSIGNSTSHGSGETHFCSEDTDGDSLLDGEEEGLFGAQVTPEDVSTVVGSPGATISLGTPASTTTVPALDSDMDNDGLTDYEEVNTYQTDPMDADTDNDMVSDGAEVATWDPAIAARLGKTASSDSRDHANPREADTDGDGLTDNLEIAYGCNCGTGQDGYVNDDDSDDDGLQDGEEYELFVVGRGIDDVAVSSGNDGELDDDSDCAICDPDSDGDGLSDGNEVGIGTDPLDWDSDNDGLSDREELQIYFTDPNNPDTDGDQADGNIAARDPTISPTIPGHSGNGSIAALSDCEEALSGTSYPPFGNPQDETDPLQADTDGDGLPDGIEFRAGCSCEHTPGSDCSPYDPIVAYDPTKDGYANSFDSDGDGLRDDLDTAADVGESNGNDGELTDDNTHSICDPDSDGDGLLDGGEQQTGTDPLDWANRHRPA